MQTIAGEPNKPGLRFESSPICALKLLRLYSSHQIIIYFIQPKSKHACAARTTCIISACSDICTSLWHTDDFNSTTSNHNLHICCTMNSGRLCLCLGREKGKLRKRHKALQLHDQAAAVEHFAQGVHKVEAIRCDWITQRWWESCLHQQRRSVLYYHTRYAHATQPLNASKSAHQKITRPPASHTRYVQSEACAQHILEMPS
jgi:hypothetical protein